MTSPDFSVNTDGLNTWSADTYARAVDFHYRPVDSDGDWPSHRSMRRFQGQVQSTGQGLGDDMDGHAEHGEASATAYKQQDGMNAGTMKDLMGMATGAGKDVMGLTTNVAQVGTQMVTTLGQGATQAGTTAMTAAMTAATTAAKAPGGAPGGAPVGLTGGTGSTPDSPTTTDHDGKGRHHDDAHADANS